MAKDNEGFNEPKTTARPDCDGVPVNSPLNKPRVRYDKAESLGIHRDPTIKDSYLERLKRK